MTAKAAFSPEEWKMVLEGPPSAGMIVVTAARGCTEVKHLRDAVALLQTKATTEELDDYRRFVVALASKVAAAHKEEGQSVSPAEAEAIQEITVALGISSS